MAAMLAACRGCKGGTAPACVTAVAAQAAGAGAASALAALAPAWPASVASHSSSDRKCPPASSRGYATLLKPCSVAHILGGSAFFTVLAARNPHPCGSLEQGTNASTTYREKIKVAHWRAHAGNLGGCPFSITAIMNDWLK